MPAAGCKYSRRPSHKGQKGKCRSEKEHKRSAAAPARKAVGCTHSRAPAKHGERRGRCRSKKEHARAMDRYVRARSLRRISQAVAKKRRHVAATPYDPSVYAPFE